MSRLRQLPLACLALALWLWGTQHCTLEAAGLLDFGASAAACESDATGHCVADNCDSLENGAFRTADSSIELAPPAATCADCLLCLALLAPPTEAPPFFATTEPADCDLNWVPVWQFVRRAAPPARAPDATLA